jgi:hypothetical protein
MRIRPEVGAYSPARSLTSVVLPAPLSPTSAIRSPGFTLKRDIVKNFVIASRIGKANVFEGESRSAFGDLADVTGAFFFQDQEGLTPFAELANRNPETAHVIDRRTVKELTQLENPATMPVKKDKG